MVGSKLAIATLNTTLSTLLILGVGIWSRDAIAQISTSQDTVWHFKGIVAREDKCPDRINSKPANSCSESIINLPLRRVRDISLSAHSDLYRLTDHPRSNWEVQTGNQDWLNLNQGEGYRELIRFVFWRF